MISPWRDRDAAERDGVAVGPQFHVVAHPQRRDDEAEFGGHVTAQHGDALEQGTSLPGIGERDQAIADLELDRIHGQQVGHLFRTRGRRGAAAGASDWRLRVGARERERDRRPSSAPTRRKGSGAARAPAPSRTA